VVSARVSDDILTSADELATEIERFGEVGLRPGLGLLRAVYTEPWRQAMDLVRQRMEAIGLTTWFDAAGNLFGRITGTEGGPSIMTGSHIDTVPNAGKYDGTLGILGSLAAVAALKEQFGQPHRTIDVVVTCDEDGARFATEYWGSQTIAGTIEPKDLDRVRDAEGTTIGEAMRQAGFDPDRIGKARRDDVAAWIELHIEQGRVLEDEGIDVGIVTALAGRWSGTVRVVGREDHAGTTPMDARRDAMAGASRIISHAIRGAEEYGRPTVCTVGKIDVSPGATNVIPSAASFSIDARDTDAARLARLAGSIRDFAGEIAQRRDLGVSFDDFVERSPTPMDEALIDIARASAEAVGASALVMPSMASHDARILGTRWPSAMIFVPSRDGRSHCPEEYTTPQQMRKGVLVLAETLRRAAYT
jgi:allantoate deiminase